MDMSKKNKSSETRCEQNSGAAPSTTRHQAQPCSLGAGVSEPTALGFCIDGAANMTGVGDTTGKRIDFGLAQELARGTLKNSSTARWKPLHFATGHDAFDSAD
jgi:hypothetical protein